MNHTTPATCCPSCSELKKYVDQQAELISQLMRMIAHTHEKVIVMQKTVQSIQKEKEVSYAYSVSEPNQSSECRS
ncbi:hypothetical protein [Piscibacillus salipiscarius]|uniref:Uncharacterized protein n=1 Tax=Piscibacillus salipiscarius TaxID=299480 RepID=A0ABW5QAR8_9BACI